MTARWTIVIPVKGTALAKSRLEASAELTMAIALDTVAAALGVGHVIVVTSPAAASQFTALGAEVVPDPGGDLGDAVARGVAAASISTRSDEGVAVLLGDLPALTAQDLSHALILSAAHPRAMVADAENVGTVLITAQPTVSHAPAFGAGSRAAHLAAGYVEIALPVNSVLRRDVDTPAQLASLARECLGARTRAALPVGA